MNARLGREVREALNANQGDDLPVQAPNKDDMAKVMDMIIPYESGQLDMEQTLEMFRLIIQTSLAWSLQGSYGRNAERLLRAGIITCQRVNSGPLVCKVVRI